MSGPPAKSLMDVDGSFADGSYRVWSRKFSAYFSSSIILAALLYLNTKPITSSSNVIKVCSLNNAVNKKYHNVAIL